MKTHFSARLNFWVAANLVVAGAAFAPAVSSASARICLFPGSPSAALDRQIAGAVFRTAGIAASFAKQGIGEGDDDGVSLKELSKAIGGRCDVIAGFPRSPVADATGSKLLFSRGYLRSGYVSITASGADASRSPADVIAATYASPAQLIAVQQTRARLDLENTPEATVEAVAAGRARRAIVWYPALVAYRLAHPKQGFDVAATRSPYADWQLVFAFGANASALQRRVDAALAKMDADGRLAELTRAWVLPGSVKTPQAAAAYGNDDGTRAVADSTIRHADRAAATFAYRDGPGYAAAGARAAMSIADTSAAAGRFTYAVATRSGFGGPGRFIKVGGGTDGNAPTFDRAQATHGKKLYAGACAKCHGANLQGVNAPALIGPAFAPASNAHLTIGGVFEYMATNMPADRPGKMKDQDYADIMAFLLYSNGYAPGTAKMTADGVRASTTPLNAGTAAAQTSR